MVAEADSQHDGGAPVKSSDLLFGPGGVFFLLIGHPAVFHVEFAHQNLQDAQDVRNAKVEGEHFV